MREKSEVEGGEIGKRMVRVENSEVEVRDKGGRRDMEFRCRRQGGRREWEEGRLEIERL